MRKKGAKSFLFCFLTLLLLFSFCVGATSCTQKDPVTSNRVFYEYFDTVSVFYDYTGMSTEKFNLLAKSVEASLEHYHRLFDIYNEYDGLTNLATVNRMAGEGSVRVDSAIIGLLDFCIDMYKLTDGKVNVMMGSVLSLWHDLRAEGERIPTSEELSERGAHISIDLLRINKEESTVEITDPLARLDVGAIAKGYTAQLIKDELVHQGYSGLVLDLGGNICTVGTKPDGSGWQSAIRNPLYTKGEDGDRYVRTLDLSDSALVTSGVYERYYTVDGVRYHHIIDPDTLMPESRYLSVSVHTDDSGVADALSTALFNMDESEARDLVDRFADVEATFVLNSGELLIIGEKQ